jgi:hypothetical protein
VKIKIQEYVEHTDTGDMVRIEFDNFKYHITVAVTDKYQVHFEIRNDILGMIAGYDTVQEAIQDARIFITKDVKAFLKQHYGVKIDE